MNQATPPAARPLRRTPPEPALRYAAWGITGALLLAVLVWRLLAVLLAGLLVYELVHILAPRLQRRFTSERARVVAVVLLATLVALAASAGVIGAIAFFRSESGSLPALFARMAQILEEARTMLPDWLLDMLPVNADGMHKASVQWLREHATELSRVGKEAGRAVAHIVIGLVIGAMVATRESRPGQPFGPLGAALAERTTRLAEAFRRVVFAQVRISAINTVFTGLYLAVALPLFGIHLPLTKALIAITFIAGLLPVIGNLISNTVIVVVSLSQSPQVAVASLGFLVVVHKFEYFLNARIVGGQINARAWELLTAMVLLEAIFGIAGVVAAPIVYAWVKDELKDAGLL